MDQLYNLFDSIAEQLGYETEAFCMYRPQAVNVESYLRFVLNSVEPFQTHNEAIRYYITKVARPVSPVRQVSVITA